MDVIRHEHIAPHKNLRDFRRAPAEGDELLGYDNLFAWVEYLEDSNFLFGMLLGKEMKAMNILRGWV